MTLDTLHIVSSVKEAENLNRKFIQLEVNQRACHVRGSIAGYRTKIVFVSESAHRIIMKNCRGEGFYKNYIQPRLVSDGLIMIR